MLEVEKLNITSIKQNKKILNDISFKLEKADILGILGESGSGKTMMCKAIMGLLNRKVFDVKGSILLNCEDLLKMNDKQIKGKIGKDISMIMQNPMTAFKPMSKIGTHIVETLKSHKKISKNQAYNIGIKELKAMNLKRIEEIMNSYPHMLSGGMLQRIMIAITLMLEPSLVIADEATTALDVNNQCVILEELKKIRNKGISIIVVTHDFKVVEKIAKDVLVMKDGNIVEKGTASQILTLPKKEYTKEFLKASLL